MNMKRRMAFVVSAFVLFLFVAGSSQASTTQPSGIDLGGSTFFDGFGITDPGFIYKQTADWVDFHALNNANGQHIGLPVLNNEHIRGYVSANQLIYVSPFHLWGGTLGFQTLLPLVVLNAHNSQPAEANLSAVHGLQIGDLTWGPFLQMPPINVNGRPFFSQRFELDFISPIGKYDRRVDINPSSGFWSIDPEWAMTILPFEKFEISTRSHYLYNFANEHPASSTPLSPGYSYQAGQAVWVNFSASYEIIDKFNIGVNGYYFQQITLDKTSGAYTPNSKTTDLVFGPGISYTLDKRNIFLLNEYFPLVEKNTTEGNRLVFALIHVF